VEWVEVGHNRKATDKFGDEAERLQVLGRDKPQQVVFVQPSMMDSVLGGSKAEGPRVQPVGNDARNTFEGATTDKQDVFGIDRDHLLVRVFPSALRWNVDGRALKQLEECLLDPFTADITGDGRVVGFSGNLVDLVYVYDAAFGCLNVVVGSLQQACQYAFHIFPDIAGFREYGGVGNTKGNLQKAGQRTGEVCFPRPGVANHNDIGLFDDHIVFALALHKPFVVAVYGNGYHLLSLVLADDILIQELFDFARLEKLEIGRKARLILALLLLLENLARLRDTLIADVGMDP